jgi:two-component system cell cycle response regulator
MQIPESEKQGDQPPKILIVDDNVENLIALEKILADLDVVFVRALSGDEALASLLEHDFALILLDVQMPDMDGFETAELIRSDENSKHIPIVFVTAISKDQAYVFKAYASGAVDYLFKPLEPDILKSKVGVFVDLYKQKTVIAQANAQLKAANRRILEQQESMIEEERLKVLLQMAGASAHELNQPLMSLLGNIELIRMIEDDPTQTEQRLDNIETAGRRIADIVRKMQTIRRSDVITYPGGESILNLDQKINLLIVEDSDIDFEMLRALVKDQKQIQLSRAMSISEGLRLMQQTGVDIVLLDYLLPDGNGLDFIKEMETLGIEKPVIAITGHGDEVVASRMIKAGAYDYLPKAGTNQAVLLRSIKTALEQSRLKKEVTQATQKLAQMATRDGLTGLRNRRRMNEMLSSEFNRATRFGNDLACLLLDLDYFKQINDSLGHGFGDFVLHQFAARLADIVRESDACFRYGGEEFMVLMPQTDIQGAKKTAEKIRRLCDTEPYNNGDHERIVTVSIGVSSLKHRAAFSPEDLLAAADKALYRAKAEGRNRVNVYLEAFPTDTGSDGGHTIDLDFFKDRLAAILDKTKKASVEALELLVRDAGGSRFKDHNRRVTQYLGLVGAKLSLPPTIIQTLQRAAALHDCTKVLLSQTLMGKKERLNEAEMAEIKDHTSMLAEVVEPFDFFADERVVLLYHHENYNGSGYPDGLHGDQIPIGARILSIADALVAMTSDRPHRPELSAEQVVQELVGNAGTQFDPNLVGLFLDVIGENSLIDIPVQKIAEAKEMVTGIKA